VKGRRIEPPREPRPRGKIRKIANSGDGAALGVAYDGPPWILEEGSAVDRREARAASGASERWPRRRGAFDGLP